MIRLMSLMSRETSYAPVVECILYNACSIVNKWSYWYDELLLFWPYVNIIAITETWVTADHTDLLNLNFVFILIEVISVVVGPCC